MDYWEGGGGGGGGQRVCWPTSQIIAGPVPAPPPPLFLRLWYLLRPTHKSLYLSFSASLMEMFVLASQIESVGVTNRVRKSRLESCVSQLESDIVWHRVYGPRVLCVEKFISHSRSTKNIPAYPLSKQEFSPVPSHIASVRMELWHPHLSTMRISILEDGF